MTLPDVVIAGAAKCGTTSLAVSINRHSEFDAGHQKETHFFAGYEPTFQGPLGEAFNETLIGDFAAFESNYSDAELLKTVDASPGYLGRPQSAEAIAKANPDARIIIGIRHPVARAWSAHMHLLRKDAETQTFERALQLEQERLLDGWIPLFGHVHGSLYAPGIKEYLLNFGEDQVYIFRHDQFRTEPDRILGELTAFLGATSPIEPKGQHNVGGTPRSQTLHDFIRADTGARQIARRSMGKLVPEAAKIRLRSMLDRANLDRSDRPSAAAHHWIMRRVEDDLNETEDLTGFNLSSWRARPHPA